MTLKKYTVSDGKLVLTLQEAEEGGYVVSSPLDPGLWTQAKSIAEAFENARDAMKELAAARRQLTATRPATVPRHGEIKFGTARGLCKQLDIPAPPGR
jgi:predicted RNase H-like HicB family nuclease